MKLRFQFGYRTFLLAWGLLSLVVTLYAIQISRYQKVKAWLDSNTSALVRDEEQLNWTFSIPTITYAEIRGVELNENTIWLLNNTNLSNSVVFSDCIVNQDSTKWDFARNCWNVGFDNCLFKGKPQSEVSPKTKISCLTFDRCKFERPFKDVINPFSIGLLCLKVDDSFDVSCLDGENFKGLFFISDYEWQIVRLFRVLPTSVTLVNRDSLEEKMRENSDNPR